MEGSYNRYHSRDYTGVETRAHTRNGQDYEASNIFFRDDCRDKRVFAEPSSRRKSTSKSVTCMHYLHFENWVIPSGLNGAAAYISYTMIFEESIQ